MNFPDEKHLAYIQTQIVNGMKAETRETILAAYTISDQLNARGTEKEAMQDSIDRIIADADAKKLLVLSATTFAELNEVVPMTGGE
jgi:hypothetical protein